MSIISPSPINPPSAIVPKKIHFIWVGMPIPDQFVENIKAWQKMNPDYEVHLWMDTGATKPDQIEQAKRKAQIEGVKVHNLAGDENKDKDAKAFFENMKNKDIYNDELTGKDANYAAASDLLRMEILYAEGGLYVDTDLPPKEPLGNIPAPRGFVKSTNFSNDFLCATPQAALTDAFRTEMRARYQQAMSENPDLQMHRSKRSWMDRTDTTLAWTGPYLLNDVFAAERQKLGNMDEQVKFFNETQLKSLEGKFIEESAQTWRDQGPKDQKEANIYFKEELNFRLRHSLAVEIKDISASLGNGKKETAQKMALQDLAKKLIMCQKGSLYLILLRIGNKKHE